MLMNEPVDETRFEVAPLPRAGRAEDIRKHVGQSTTEPDAQRDAKSLFLSIEDLVRQQRSNGLLEDMLSAAVANLQRRRQRCREGDDVVIEQGDARLD